MASISSFRRESLIASSSLVLCPCHWLNRAPFKRRNATNVSRILFRRLIIRRGARFIRVFEHSPAQRSWLPASLSLHSCNPRLLVHYGNTGNTEILFQSVGYLNRWPANLPYLSRESLCLQRRAVTRSEAGDQFLFSLETKFRLVSVIIIFYVGR